MSLKDTLVNAIDEIYDLSVTRVGAHPKINILDNQLSYHTVERWNKDNGDMVGSMVTEQQIQAIKDVVYHVAIRNQEYIDQIIGNFDDLYVQVVGNDS